MMPRAQYLLLLVTLGCSAQTLKGAPPVDCSQGDAYEFFGADGLANAATSRALYDFEVGDTGWYQAGDCAGGHWDPNATPTSDSGAALGACVIDTATASPISGNVPSVEIEGGRCGSRRAALIESYGHSDWGSLYGTWDIGSLRPPGNGAGSEGISFWARNPDRTGHAQGATNKTIVFSVGDYRQVVAENTTVQYPTPGDFRCVPEPPTSSAVGFTDSGQLAASTRAPAPNECGNLFRAVVTTTNDWQLYLLPWSSLYQDTTPNRNPGGIDPTDIRLVQVAVPIGASVELWLDDIAFYRARTSGN